MLQIVRFPILLLFCITLLGAAYLGFSLIHLGHDKAIHFTTFFILTSEFYCLWDLFRPWKITFVCMCLGASIGLEYLQNFINSARVFDYMDIAYNVAGSALALVSCVAVHTYKRRQRYTPIESDEVDGFVNVRMSEIPV